MNRTVLGSLGAEPHLRANLSGTCDRRGDRFELPDTLSSWLERQIRNDRSVTQDSRPVRSVKSSGVEGTIY
jgi:hypothetical protein